MRATRIYAGGSAAVHSSQPALRRAWRAAVLHRGRDITASVRDTSALVLAPHPDDETLGCGATILHKTRAGTPVHVVIAADGRHAQSRSRRVTAEQLRGIRAAEAVAACRRLGVTGGRLTQLGHEDNHLAAHRAELVERLCEILDAVRPEEVYVTSPLDHHPDHRTLNAAALEALERVRQSPLVLQYPVWYWLDGPWLDLSSRPVGSRVLHFVSAPLVAAWAPGARLVSTHGLLDVKHAALMEHRSQMTNLTGESDWGVMDTSMLRNFLQPYEPFFIRTLS